MSRISGASLGKSVKVESGEGGEGISSGERTARRDLRRDILVVDP